MKIETLAALATPFVFAPAAAAQTELWTASGFSGDRYGLVVSAVGDVDADGVTDLAIGAPDADLAAPSGGAVSVVSGATGGELWAFGGPGNGDSLGFSVAGLGGDVDGDGVHDLVAGARFSDLAGPSFGAAYVLSGADGSVIRVHVGAGSNGRFGEGVGAAGDVDMDGTVDVIVGARLDAASGSNTGAARVFSGANGALLYELFGDDSADLFGRAVGTAGDVDGDGHDDFFASAPGDDDNGALSGSLRVYSGASGAELRRFDGDAAGDLFGGKAVAFGDVDGDGFPEFAVGMIGSSFAATDRGAVRVFDGATGATLYTLGGSTLGGEYGAAVSAAGDVDFDGAPDLLVGARLDDDGTGLMLGSASVHSGVDGTEIWKVFGPTDLSQFGDTAACLGDANGDGVPDVAVGAFGDDDVIALSGRDTLGANFCGPAVPNSTGVSARILALGSSVAAANDLDLHVVDAPASAFGLMVTSTDTMVVANPGGVSGTLCIAGPDLARHPSILQTSAAGTLLFEPDLTLIPLGASGTAVLAGDTRNWQFWFRDGMSDANFTDAVAVSFD
ncbi:MAG: hypothetical protein AAFR54_09295 [Planctomycetota bacterium]